jgi:hypothetical protein
MLNDGSGVFSDIIGTTGIDPNDLGAWENQSGDFDNNGFVDIFSELSNELYLNNGDLTFTGQSLNFDEGAIGDFNNDGFLDVVNDGNLYINDGNSNNWVKLGLQGIQSNRNGIGARVEIVGDWGNQMREVRSGQGFSHMNSLIAHFGIGTSTSIDQVIVHWPSGIVDILQNPDINTQHIIIEGSTLGVNDNKIEGLSLFPNPTVNVLKFSLQGLENTPVSIIDANGKVVLRSAISSENEVDVASLSSGLYVLQLQVDKKFANYKFIKN